jgi:hypothetical protein
MQAEPGLTDRQAGSQKFFESADDELVQVFHSLDDVAGGFLVGNERFQAEDRLQPVADGWAS